MPLEIARRAFVTGGTRFVGLNLVRSLMERGWDVTALHRASSDLSLLKRFGPRLAMGSITDAPALLAAMPQGTDTVFHVAGNTAMWGKLDAEQTCDNVDGGVAVNRQELTHPRDSAHAFEGVCLRGRIDHRQRAAHHARCRVESWQIRSGPFAQGAA